MNLSELARKLRLSAPQLKEILPQLGFDIGLRAIKVDDRVAQKIIRDWANLYKKWQNLQTATQAQAIKSQIAAGPKLIKIPSIITVRDLAAKMNLPVTKVIQELMKNGIFASLNERIDFETATIIADDLGIQTEREDTELDLKPGQEERLKEVIESESKENLKPRPPVVVVMGHVDHGKTKLLDAIRKTNVVAGEAGGITQHIGAYQVEKKNRKITFIDTPGHEAFTAMRSRGARIADVAILVVAADDSVMPQTIEALKIIEAAKLPMIVAINKIDKPEANLDRVKQDLSRHNLIPEDWGGKTIMVAVSALKGTGIDDLLEMVLLVADLDKDKIVANPDRQALGTVVESHVNKNEGPVATVLIQAGQLKINDILSIDHIFYGKARAMKDWKGQAIKEALPSTPVRILGLKVAPKVGDIIEVVSDTANLDKKAYKKLSSQETASAFQIGTRSKKEETVKTKQLFNVIVRADVLGSLEAILESLEKIDHPEVGLEVVVKGLGNINENDVLRAESASALVLGFNVRLSPSAEKLAREKNIEIKLHRIIYDLLAEVKERLEKMLAPEIIRTDLGEAKILQIFRKEAQYAVIGCRVLRGKVDLSAKISVQRQNHEVSSGLIEQLQHNKQNVKEVYEGQECGIKYKGKPNLEVNDTLIIYKEDERVRKLT